MKKNGPARGVPPVDTLFAKCLRGKGVKQSPTLQQFVENQILHAWSNMHPVISKSIIVAAFAMILKSLHLHMNTYFPKSEFFYFPGLGHWPVSENNYFASFFWC